MQDFTCTTKLLAVSTLCQSYAKVMGPSGRFPVGVADLEYVGYGVSMTPDVELDPSKVREAS